MSKNYDCIVIGAGHAGIEAANAAATIGLQTALITISIDRIADMSCNPAIGGLAKGQITREIDALGGLMAEAIDATGIQFRILNRSKGPAVQSPRAQADKKKYSFWMQDRLLQTQNLDIIEAMATDIIVESDSVRAVRCADGNQYKTQTVIVATGTFLRGVMHIGTEQIEGGRRGDPASVKLSQCLQKLGFDIQRLKTGTPVRLDGATVDYEKCEIQNGDDQPMPFSFLNDSIDRPQTPCWITYTNDKIHKLLRDNIDKAPLYSGQIKSVGPRYCPSIEVKILRFADKEKHQVFLEPEDEQISTIYCNGISTSYPKDIQEKMIRLMTGTENARILHWAYAIEYDYCSPVQLKNNLETWKISGLFFAGQINGTSGYEEAGGQGIIAGINAARKCQAREPIILGRDQAYIGVMIDDFLTRGIDEPYRMFTSRAEYRLLLRSDNADRRLTPVGKDVGLVKNDRWMRYQKKLADIDRLQKFLVENQTKGKRLMDQLHMPHNDVVAQLQVNKNFASMSFSREVIDAVAIDAKYQGYIEKQKRLTANMQSLEKKKIPDDLDYNTISHLRAEAKQKLSTFRPATLAQAGRISGITPADLTVIRIHLKKNYFSKQ